MMAGKGCCCWDGKQELDGGKVSILYVLASPLTHRLIILLHWCSPRCWGMAAHPLGGTLINRWNAGIPAYRTFRFWYTLRTAAPVLVRGLPFEAGSLTSRRSVEPDPQGGTVIISGGSDTCLIYHRNGLSIVIAYSPSHLEKIRDSHYALVSLVLLVRSLCPCLKFDVCTVVVASSSTSKVLVQSRHCGY